MMNQETEDIESVEEHLPETAETKASSPSLFDLMEVEELEDIESVEEHLLWRSLRDTGLLQRT